MGGRPVPTDRPHPPYLAALGGLLRFRLSPPWAGPDAMRRPGLGLGLLRPHEPLGWRPTVLVLTIRRYRCPSCGHVWRQDTSRRAKLSQRAQPTLPATLSVRSLTAVAGWLACRTPCPHLATHSLLSQDVLVPSVGFEPTPPAPEAGALSPELRGPVGPA